MMARLGFVAGLLIAACVSGAKSESNPYAAILERNVFGLREPAPPAPPPAPAPIAHDAGELVLTGVVDFRTAQWALLTRTERGKPARSYTLSLGQQEDDLQVLDINAEAATVRVRNGTVELVLSLKKAAPQEAGYIEELGRKYVQQAKPFVDEHTHAHAAREQREAERRRIERAVAEAELAAQQISTHMDNTTL